MVSSSSGAPKAKQRHFQAEDYAFPFLYDFSKGPNGNTKTNNLPTSLKVDQRITPGNRMEKHRNYLGVLWLLRYKSKIKKAFSLPIII